ncbi:hypothetical protein Pmani_014107 [Petrolisthes manimaculis]|uniref:Uncharacterized protein n=1 Tax=Petrolisthes manimaculis TaxID=1843537 RepID=A0AAE1PUM7_9EUCA|nr:hypothetical protein Pmani_014107 [Petrolisthes manimaculis]
MAGAEEGVPPTLSGASLRSFRPPVRSAARGKCGGGHAGVEGKVRGVWSSRGRLLPAGSPAGKTGVACSSSQPSPRLSASPAALKPTKPVISAPRPMTRPSPTRAHPSVQCPTKIMKGQLLTSDEVMESVMAGAGCGGDDDDSSGVGSSHLLRRAAKSMGEEEDEEFDEGEEEEDTEDVEEEEEEMGADEKTGKRRAARYDSADSSDRLVFISHHTWP